MAPKSHPTLLKLPPNRNSLLNLPNVFQELRFGTQRYLNSFFPDATDYARNVMGAGCYKVGPGYRGCLGGAVNLWDGIMYQGKSLLAIKEELKAESQPQKKAKTKKK